MIKSKNYKLNYKLSGVNIGNRYQCINKLVDEL
jgi:hypothetical protein